MKRRWIRRTIGILAGIACIPVLASVLLQTSVAKRFAIEQLRNYLRSRSGIDLRISRLHWSPFRGSASLEDITLRTVSASDLPPLFSAARIDVKLGIFNILRGNWVIDNLHMAKPAIHYYIEKNGRTNLPQSGKSSGSAPDLLITHAEIVDGSFKLQDLQSEISSFFPQWRLSIDGNRFTRAHHIVFNCLRDSSFEYKAHAFPITSLEFSAVLQKTAVQIERAQLIAANSKISAKGSITDFLNPNLDLQLIPSLDLNRIARILDLKDPLNGAVSGTIQVKGKLDEIEIASQLMGAQFPAIQRQPFQFMGVQLHLLQVKSRAVWLRDAEKLIIHELDLTSPEGSLKGSAVFSPGSKPGINSIDAAIRGWDLFPLWKQLKPPFDLASRCSGNISLKWKGAFSPEGITGNAHLNLTTTRTPSRNLLPVSGILDARMQSNHLYGNLRSFTAFGAQVDGQLSLYAFKEIEGTLQADSRDLDILAKQLSPFLGKSDPILGIAMAGPSHFSATISGRLNRPTISVKIDVPRLQAGPLSNLRVEADALIQDSQIAFKGAVGLPQDSAITVHGNLDLRGAGPILSLDADTEGTSVAAISATLDSDISAQGRLKARLHLDGPTDNLQGNLSISADELSLYEEPLGHLDADLRLSDGTVQSTQFKLLKEPQNPDANYLIGQLSYSLESSQFQFQASGKDIASNQLAILNGSPVRANINMFASGTGTVRNPSIDMKLDCDDLQIGPTSFGPVSVNGTLRNEDISLNASGPRLNLTSTAIIVNRDPYAFRFELQAKDSDIAQLGFKLPNGQSLTGTIRAAFSGSGNFKDLDQATVSAQIDNFNLQAGKIDAHTQAPVQIEYRKNSVGILSTASIVSGNSMLEMSGSVPIRQPAPEGALRVKGRIDLAQAMELASLKEGLGAEGILNLDFSFNGDAQRIRSKGGITLDDGILRLPQIAVPLTGIAIRASLQEGALALQQADAVWGQGRISLTGELPFGLLSQNIPVLFPKNDAPARFALDLKNLKPELTGKLPPEITGLISLNATGEASSLDLRSLVAKITFNDLSLQANDIGFSQKEPISIAVRDGVASILRMSLIGDQGSFEASGSAGIYANIPWDLRLSGNLDAAMLALFSQDLKAAGKMQIQANIAGDRGSPTISGFAAMKGGKLILRNPRVVADSLSVNLSFSPNKITVQEFKGTLNGGTIALAHGPGTTGAIGYGNGTFKDFDLEFELQDVFMDSPEKLKSASSGNLTITSSDNDIVIGGSLRILESAYRENIEMGGRLLSYLRAPQMFEISHEPSPFLSRIRLNVAMRPVTPLLVQNNIAKVEAGGSLRLVGTFYEPSLVGRITLNEGGAIVLNQQTYYIVRGSITLANQYRIEPELNIQAQTKVGDYDIILQLTGLPERFVTTLTSEPPLPETDIISLILTGKTASETQNLGAVRTQALSLIAGQLGEETIAREARQALHLSTFRIDPGLIASESDPGARLTLGQDITRKLNFTYSMNLTDGGQQIWAAQYKIAQRLTSQATKQQNNTYRFEFRHDLLFGGPASTRSSRRTTPKFTIGTLQFQGASPYSDKTLLDKFKIEPGDKYEFQKIQKGLDRLHDFYAGEKRLQADIRLHRETKGKTIDLQLSVDPGPIVDFSFDGFPVSGKVKEQVATAWSNGAFDSERFDNAVEAIRRPLIQEGYLQSKIAYDVETNESKRIQFHITPGARFSDVTLDFSGAKGIGAEQLAKTLDQANLKPDIYADPQKVVEYLKRYYLERGYLEALVGPLQPVLDPENGSGKILIPIQEGPLFTIGELKFSGNHAFNYNELWIAIPTSSGRIFDPNTLRSSVRAVETLYRRKGYNDVAVTYKVDLNSKASHANIVFDIAERKQSIIRDVTIEGNNGTSRDFVQKQLDFGTGDVLDFGKIDETRKRFYTSGIYSSVDFQTEELPGSPSNAQEKSIRIKVRLRETRPYRLRYGLFYDTERGLGGLLEAQNMNLLGRASNLGVSLRYDTDLKEGRLYYNEPFIQKIHVKMDVSAFIQRETRVSFSANRIGFSLIRQKNLPKAYRLDYGYRYDHVRWDGLPPDPTIFQAEVPIARLIGTITRDTRDNILDATRGEFTSHSFEFGPRLLGSEIGFTRYSGQYFRYVPLDKFFGKPIKDKEGRPLPTNLVYAGALRLGLTSAFGGKEVISPERFFAGGGTTMRGFQQDRLGPLEMLPDEKTLRPTGGEALFLFNNELRFPIVGILQGVGFLDIGNVYPTISDFNFNLRKSAGAGLRIKIKYIPLRFDYGFKLDRRTGEQGGSAFFFSIGQAF
jgi:outer membrane protein assembly complex protein YaeT